MAEHIINNITELEDAINKILTGDTKQNILKFVRHLASINDISTSGNNYDGRIFYKGHKICDFHISGEYGGYPGPYTIWVSRPDDYTNEIESFPFDDRLKEIAWANAHESHCEICSGNGDWCVKRNTKIFGRHFENACSSASIFFSEDPDAEAIDCAIKLMEMSIHIIDMEKNLFKRVIY